MSQKLLITVPALFSPTRPPTLLQTPLQLTAPTAKELMIAPLFQPVRPPMRSSSLVTAPVAYESVTGPRFSPTRPPTSRPPDTAPLA